MYVIYNNISDMILHTSIKQCEHRALYARCKVSKELFLLGSTTFAFSVTFCSFLVLANITQLLVNNM